MYSSYVQIELVCEPMNTAKVKNTDVIEWSPCGPEMHSECGFSCKFETNQKN